jgi:hypothetical protein
MVRLCRDWMRGLVERYRYCKVGALYCCLDQCPSELAWLLWSKTNPFEFGKGKRGWRRRIPAALNKGLQIAGLLRPVALQHVGVQEPDAVLPAFGHLAHSMRLGGYKFFDLKSNRVITHLSPSLDDQFVSRQIRNACEAGCLSLGPEVHACSPSDRSYVESYINGIRIAGKPWLVYCERVIDIMERLLLSYAPQVADRDEYVATLVESITGEKGLAGLDGRIDPEMAAIVERFAKATGAEIARGPDDSVHLAMAHGDLFPRNLISTNGGVVALDWDEAGMKSLLYDIHLVTIRTAVRWNGRVNKDWVAWGTGRARERLSTLRSDLARELSTVREPLYRRLFYLEYLRDRVEELWFANNVGLANRWLKHNIVSHVHKFRCFERHAGSTVVA